ncbi:MAG: MAPEG family protein [Deltaproteobacteria bacterium]|nr:MAPEG family protein [Deltaproteobacteria bacterium]
MTTDLWMLVLTGLLCLLLPSVYLLGRMQTPGGMEWALGNRDTQLAIPDWAARAQRAHLNLIENLAPFAILVLTAHVAGKANSMTAIGSILFFAGRVAHAAVYIAGIIGLRTAVFFAAVAGEVLILLQLLH